MLNPAATPPQPRPGPACFPSEDCPGDESSRQNAAPKFVDTGDEESQHRRPRRGKPKPYATPFGSTPQQRPQQEDQREIELILHRSGEPIEALPWRRMHRPEQHEIRSRNADNGGGLSFSSQKSPDKDASADQVKQRESPRDEGIRNGGIPGGEQENLHPMREPAPRPVVIGLPNVGDYALGDARPAKVIREWLGKSKDGESNAEDSEMAGRRGPARPRPEPFRTRKIRIGGFSKAPTRTKKSVKPRSHVRPCQPAEKCVRAKEGDCHSIFARRTASFQPRRTAKIGGSSENPLSSVRRITV